MIHANPRQFAGLLVSCVIGSIAGCEQAPTVAFRAHELQMVALDLVPAHRQQITTAMTELFGTPDQPRAPDLFQLDSRRLERAAGPATFASLNSASGLYRQHCAHCHGISGDGRGPTAALLTPYPRDFRAGKFKFKSTYLSDKPTDDDLRKVLVEGLPGSAMPSFRLLDDEALDALVEYVKYLSIRGEVEALLAVLVADELDYDSAAGTTTDPFEPAEDEDDQALVDEVLELVAEGWLEAVDAVVEQDADALPATVRTPQAIAASAAKGRELFYSERGGCFQCHGPLAQGDGPQVDYDDWSKQTLEFRESLESLARQVTELRSAVPALHGENQAAASQELAARQRQWTVRSRVLAEQLEIRQSRPRNLRLGQLRGGQRPVDIYLRIHQGIPGTPMPAHGPRRPGATGALTDAEIWNLVDYVRSLPWEGDSAQAAHEGGKD